jgi:hypothetical protein
MKINLQDELGETVDKLTDAILSEVRPDGTKQERTLRQRIYWALHSVLDHGWLDDDMGNALVREVAGEVGIEIEDDDFVDDSDIEPNDEV